jgi:hypothetical protein
MSCGLPPDPLLSSDDSIDLTKCGGSARRPFPNFSPFGLRFLSREARPRYYDLPGFDLMG